MVEESTPSSEHDTDSIMAKRPNVTERYALEIPEEFRNFTEDDYLTKEEQEKIW